MVDLAIGPLRMKILSYESSPFTVNRFHQLFGVRLAGAIAEAADG